MGSEVIVAVEAIALEEEIISYISVTSAVLTIIIITAIPWLLFTDPSCTGHTRDAAFAEPSQAAPGLLEVRNTLQVSRDVSRWRMRGAGTSVMPVCSLSRDGTNVLHQIKKTG